MRRRWRRFGSSLFEPAEINNRPAPIRINYRYDFVIKEEAPTTAQFAGLVKNHQTGEALAGVSIALDTGRDGGHRRSGPLCASTASSRASTA